MQNKLKHLYWYVILKTTYNNKLQSEFQNKNEFIMAS